MHKQFYFLSPVEVVKVTSQNLEEVAKWCGGSIHQTESRRVPGRMDSYVLVPTPSEKRISWAFPGMFITKRLVVTVKDELRETFAVFRRDYFEKNYFDTPKDAADKTWERQAGESTKVKVKQKNAEVHVTVNVGDALKAAQDKVAELEARLADKETVEKTVHRDASNGEFVTAEYAAEHPETTVKETVEVPVEDLRGLSESEVEKALS